MGFADLEAEQVALVVEAERTLDTDLVMAYAPSAWGTVDPDAVGEGLDPAELPPSSAGSSPSPTASGSTVPHADGA